MNPPSESGTRIIFEVPVKTESTSNLREHPMARHKRTSAQKAATRRRCPEWTAGPVVVVRLTRVSPRRLDDDNLRGALKSVRDGVAQWLRLDDASPLVRWEYEQEKGAASAVRVEVLMSEPTGACATFPSPLPVVSADAGGMRVVREPGTGSIRAPGDISALATPNVRRPAR